MEEEWRVVPTLDITLGRDNHDGVSWSIQIDRYTDKERKYVRGVGEIVDGKFIPHRKDGQYKLVKTHDNKLILLERIES